MLLAGDLGGTKTMIGLFREDDARPAVKVFREYATLDFDSLDEIVATFIEETGATDVTAVCIGVAGAVSGLRARLTNVPWIADLTPIGERIPDAQLMLLNDLEAMAYSVPVLEGDELLVLQPGVTVPNSNAALIAAGTGLGEALLHNVNGRFIPSASEGGHADFSARTARELELMQALLRTHSRVDVETVVSGPGLVNLFRFTHGSQNLRTACRAIGPDVDVADLPPAITECALEGRCERCGEALEMFVDAYGAEAGNLALRSVATGGVYIGGGIAPKILPALEAGGFIEAFLDKDPMADWMAKLPVKVILNNAAGLLGAAVKAQTL